MATRPRASLPNASPPGPSARNRTRQTRPQSPPQPEPSAPVYAQAFTLETPRSAGPPTPTDPEQPPRFQRYAFMLPAERGGVHFARAEATVIPGPNALEVVIRVARPDLDRITGGRHPLLHWGLYRASPDKWSSSEGVQILSAAEMDPSRPTRGLTAYQPAPGSTRTPFRLSSDQKYYELRLAVPRNLAPLTLAFTFFVEKDEILKRHEKHFRPRDLRHCSVLLGGGPGSPAPYGASLVATAADAKGAPRYTVNFSVFSQHAKAVMLVLVRRRKGAAEGAQKGFLEIALDPAVNKTGGVWHVALEGLRDLNSLYYGWRAEGSVRWEDGGRFDHSKIMLDPYAPWVEEFEQPQAMQMMDWTGKPPPLLLGCLASVLAAAAAPVDVRVLSALTASTSAAPVGPHEGLRCMAVHVPTFSNHPSVPEVVRGTYLGVSHRAVQLRDAGINCILLAQVTLSREGLGPLGKAPLSFLAPDTNYVAGLKAGDAGVAREADRQLRQMIAELKALGIKVMMQLSFSFTAEGHDRDNAPALSLRGLDNTTYYRAGGVLNCGHPETERLIGHTIRHWHTRYGIDGFYLASPEPLVMSQEGVVQDSSRAAELLAFETSGVTIIAGGSLPSLLPREGQRGFPHYGVIAEAPGRFQDDVISSYLFKNQKGFLSSVAQRLMGSPDLCEENWSFPGNMAVGRSAARGAIWNALVRPGAGGLWRAAEAACEGRLDGIYGGALCRTAILLAAVARGVPLITLGEDYVTCPPEPARTQLMTFMKTVLEVRALYPSLFCGTPGSVGGPVVSWYDQDGRTPDWGADNHSNVLGMMLVDVWGYKAIYAVFNPGHACMITLPDAQAVSGAGWTLSVNTAGGDTAMPPSYMAPGSTLWMPAGSGLLFELLV